MEEPHPSFLPKRLKTAKLDFDALKKKYGYRCATCGSEEGKPNLRYHGVITKLQRGRMNPRKPYEPGNIIPQCETCNRADRDKWVYDKRGRVIGVARAEVIIQSVKNGYLTEKYQRRLYEFLRRKFEKGEQR